MLVDTHCHLNCLDLSKYDGDLSLAIRAAEKNGVAHFLCVCIDLKHFSEILAIANRYENIKASVGLHPNEKVKEPTIEYLVQLAQDEQVVAIGETGLDYYRCTGDMRWQQERFRIHIRAAKEVKKPLIIHSRQAREDTIRVMQEEQADEIGGVMHCFTETYDMAKQALDLGFYISFSGIVTFKNAKELQEVVKKVPLENMLIETDSPYLAPEPYRGKSNEPAYVRYVAEKIAELKGVTYEEVAKQTTDNYFKLFLKS